MSKKRVLKPIAYLLVALILLFGNYTVVYSQPTVENKASIPSVLSDIVKVKAASAMLAEIEGGQILYGVNTDAKLHISAACKLMTVLIAVENSPLTSNVTISKDTVDVTGSALSLSIGEKYSMDKLLSAIMLTSANDAAIAVAEHVSGSVKEFVNNMNKMAEKLNMTNTYFTNPTGLYDEKQYTTAQDIFLLMKYALQNASFKRLFSLKAMPWAGEDGDIHILTSQNQLFWSYEGIEGGKTGYNEKELPSLIATATRNNITLLCILLDSPEQALYPDAASMLDAGFQKFRKSILVRSNERLHTINVEGEEINLIALKNVYYLHPIGDDFIQELSIDTNDKAPIKMSQIAGTASYLLNDGTVINVPLYPDREITQQQEDFRTLARKKLTENKDILYLIYFLLAVEALIILFRIVQAVVRLFKRSAKKDSR